MAASHEAVIEGSLHSHDDKGVVRIAATYGADINDVWSAITDPGRLAIWYGTVEGDLRVGGEFTASISISGWDGRGHVDACDPPRLLGVTMWEEVGKESVDVIQLAPDSGRTALTAEVRGVPLDLVWAYGAGWHLHAENLGLYLAESELASSDRWNELEPIYRAKPVTPLAR